MLGPQNAQVREKSFPDSRGAQPIAKRNVARRTRDFLYASLRMIDDANAVLAAAILQGDWMADLTARYAVREEIDRSWTVYDVFTGLPAKPSTWFLVELSEKQAEMYCTIVNAKDAARRGEHD
ncbi:hypothetical protein JL39_29030 [Rhizobium sp. YS-1r]|nr:hypothetical protein JL39_29030 [Rhizobium sp. YS-1r]